MERYEKELHEEIGREISRLYDTLLRKRSASNWEAKLNACSYIHHRDNYEGTKVTKRTTYDDGAMEFFEVFRDGMVGYIMPSDSTWARLIPKGDFNVGGSGFSGESFTDIDRSSQMWVVLERLNKAVLQQYASSNYYTEIKEAMTDLLATGTCYMMALEDSDGGIYYTCVDPQEVVIAENQYHRVDVLARRMRIEAVDLVRLFPNAELKNARESVRNGSGDRRTFSYIEAVVPSDYLYSTITESPFNIGKGHRFAHLVYIPEEQELVQDKGYDEFFVFACRRDKNNDKSAYGTGLAERNLANMVKVDDYARNIMRTGQRIADPPINIPPALKGKFSARPAMVNVVPDMSQQPQIMDFTSPNFNMYIDLYLKEKESLRSLFKADLFTTVMSSTDSRRTAYEVSERKNEALTLLALQIADMNRELITPIYKRTLKMLIRNRAGLKGMLKDFGKMDEFIDEHLEVALDSVFVRRLQNYLNTQGTTTAISNVMAVMQIAPETSLNYNWDAISRKFAVGSGLEAEDLVPYAEVRNQKRRMAESQAQKANVESEQIQAKANADNAKALNMLGVRNGAMLQGGAQ